MPFNERDLSDYVDVAQRIADFREQWPEGSLRPWNPAEPFRFMQAQGFNKDGSVEQQSFIVVVAAAYRHGLDDNPGIGMAWEVFPGRTPYTRGSELQNAETSAWGRAIIAIGASDSKRGIASREEVRNRRAEREDGLPVNKDGSLSRSRTTDEEKAAAGVMTAGQQAAHNALRREGTADTDVRIQVLGATPEGDLWQLGTPASGSVTSPGPAAAPGGGANGSSGGSGGMPAPDAPGTPAENRPGTIDAQQIKQLKILYGELGVTDRDKQLGVTMGTLGLDVLASHSRLSYVQGVRLVAALREQLKAEARR
jgi:hypothetical protein